MANSQTGGAPSDPRELLQFFHGAQASAALNSAIELDLFSALCGGPQEPGAVAERIKCPPRTTRILLNALVALGFLAKEGTRYRLTPSADAHLVPGRPMYMGDFAGISGSKVMWNGLTHLTESLRAGGTVLDTHAETPNNPFWEIFARSSGSMAMPASMALEGILHGWLAGKPKVRTLDIAAGSGIYGYTLALKNPNVELTSLDWPNVLVETRRWGEKLGLDPKRVKYLEGNLFEVEYGGPYDLIVLSHVYHHFDPPTCQALTRKVAKALAPGGKVAVQDFLVDGENPAAAMFAITMLITTRKGESYASEDYRGWFVEAGLKPPAVHPSVGMPTSFLVADKG